MMNIRGDVGPLIRVGPMTIVDFSLSSLRIFFLFQELIQNSFKVLHPGFDRVMINHTRASKENLFYWLKSLFCY